MSVKLNLIGHRYGRLTVVRETTKRHGCVTWLCVCDCGNEKTVITNALRSGNTKSCGCYKSESIRNRLTKHGLASRGAKSHPLYFIWLSMRSRCYNGGNVGYKWYGERGITMCDEWLNNPKTFVKWCITNEWRKGLQVDRICNDGNYEPENVRFVTSRKNCLNKRLLICTNKSGYEGVCFRKDSNNWRSYINTNGKIIHFGSHSTPWEACCFRNEYIKDNNLQHEYKVQSRKKGGGSNGY